MRRWTAIPQCHAQRQLEAILVFYSQIRGALNRPLELIFVPIIPLNAYIFHAAVFEIYTSVRDWAMAFCFIFVEEDRGL